MMAQAAVANVHEVPASVTLRRRIAFFDFADVFEDFYPHYSVDQRTFATRFTGTANHAFGVLLQREVGDVTWYVTSLSPQMPEARHEVTGCLVKFVPSSLLHRVLWRAFWLPRGAWRWRTKYRAFSMVAAYAAPLSLPLWSLVRRDRPDVIFVQSYSSGRFDVLLLMARALGIPLIAYHSGGRPEEYTGATIRRWTLRRADRIIASGRGEAEMLERRYGVPRGRIRVILTPIDTVTFRPMDRTAACQRRGLQASRRYLLYVGRLENKVKRVSAIIEAFSRAAADQADADLLIVGNGKDEDRMRARAEELAPGRVHFLGWIDEPQAKAELYNCAEALVLASPREGFPTVVGEAMACGTPVVSTDVGSVSELVEPGRTGWLVAPGDDAALARALTTVLADRQGVRSMRAAARDVAEDRVSVKHVTDALRACFDMSR